MAAPISIQVGRKIRTLRQRRSWRQSDLAERAGISKTHLSDLERGKREICLLMLERIANAFGVRPADLLL